MDLAIFTGCLLTGTLVGLTLKKHNIYLVPQELGLFMTKRQNQLNM